MWLPIGSEFTKPPIGEFLGLGSYTAPDDLFRLEFRAAYPLSQAAGWAWVRGVHLALFGDPIQGLTPERHYTKWSRVYPETGFQTFRIPYPAEFLSAYISSQFLEVQFGSKFRLGVSPRTDWTLRAWFFQGSGPTATQSIIADGGIYNG